MAAAIFDSTIHRGFALWIRPKAGLPMWAEADFIQRLEDYLTAHDLSLDGDTADIIIRSSRRDLHEVDQVDLLDWLLDDPFPAAARLGALSAAPDGGAVAGCGVHADWTDMALGPLSWLYRMHRISAAQLLQILGAHRAGPQD